MDSNFPAGVWDGLSENTQRTSRLDDQSPDGRDWDRIVSEVVAVQNYLLVSAPEGYSAVASENISAGQFVHLLSDGRLAVAEPNFNSVTGLAISAAQENESCNYVRRGRVVAPGTLTPGATYFLEAGGQLSETPPSSGFVISVGQAQSATIFDLEIGAAMRL